MHNALSNSQKNRRGVAALWILILFACIGAGTWYGMGYSSTPGEVVVQHDAILHTVKKHDFELTITERGAIESAGSTEIRSKVKAGNGTGVSILRIVPEGTTVAKGDFLVELDSSGLENDSKLQQVTVNTAEATTVEAKNLYETALIARQEYLEGTFVQELQTLESEAFVAEENLSRAEDYLEFSQRLAAKGYVNELQLEADRFAVDKSRKELDAAQTKIKVLRDFTKAKMLKQLESDIIIAKSKWDSAQKSLEVEQSKLEEIIEQIRHCIITSPRDGLVKYAHGDERNRGGEEFVVEEGAQIRERQTIIELPDPSSMQVAVTINESLIQYVKEGMPAVVSPIGADNLLLNGRVLRVNQYAEPSNWRRANVKDYKAIVAISEASDRIKSGMTASVSISSIFVPDTIQAPVQSVYAHGGQTYCFVDRSGKLIAQPVDCGPTNDRFFVIKSGLEPGDQIAANPRRLINQVDLPEVSPEQTQQTVDFDSQKRLLKLRGSKETAVADSDADKKSDSASQGG